MTKYWAMKINLTQLSTFMQQRKLIEMYNMK